VTDSAPLRVYPDHVLREHALPVEEITEEIPLLVNDMIALMIEHHGIGLAAPQIGMLQQIIVIRDGDEFVPLINPEIQRHEDKHQMPEGCLSLPGIEVNITRDYSLHIQAIRVSGDPLEMEVEGLPARIIQHEVDHLNGVLIIDHATSVERFMLKKQLHQLTRLFQP